MRLYRRTETTIQLYSALIWYAKYIPNNYYYNYKLTSRKVSRLNEVDDLNKENVAYGTLGEKRMKNYSVKPAFRISMANHSIWIPIFDDTVVERKKSTIGILRTYLKSYINNAFLQHMFVAKSFMAEIKLACQRQIKMTFISSKYPKNVGA